MSWRSTLLAPQTLLTVKHIEYGKANNRIFTLDYNKHFCFFNILIKILNNYNVKVNFENKFTYQINFFFFLKKITRHCDIKDSRRWQISSINCYIFLWKDAETTGNNIEVQKQEYFIFHSLRGKKIKSLLLGHTIVKVIPHVFRTSWLRAKIRKKKWLLEFSLHTPRDIYLRGLERYETHGGTRRVCDILALSYLNKNINAVMQEWRGFNLFCIKRYVIYYLY